MAAALYLDTSAVIRALLETGTTPELEQAIREAPALVTSRLSHVEASRALLRLRLDAYASEERLADAERRIDSLWARCETYELSGEVCELAGRVAPHRRLRALDALHLATYLLARRQIEGLELLTVDARLADAARGA